MRAATVTEYGATPVVREIPTPKPGQGQVLIKLRAAGMNPMDLWLASGAWKPTPATFPMVLGADGAGVVEELGEGTSRYSVRDDLFGQLLIAPLGSAGTYAEYVAVTEDAPLARVPDGVDDGHAPAGTPSGGACARSFSTPSAAPTSDHKALGAALPVSADDAVSMARVRFRNRRDRRALPGWAAPLKLPGGSGDGSAEVLAGGDAQFGEHVAQVPLDGMGADEQLGGDLLVGVPVPGELGDLGLPGGEVGEGLHGALAHGFPGGQQLAAGAFGEPVHAHRGQHLVRGAKLLAGIDTAISPAEPFPV